MKRLAPILMMLVIVLGLMAIIKVPTVYAGSNPTIAQTVGGHGVSVTSIALTLTNVVAGDAIVVYEYFGIAQNPCSYILTPTDNHSNTYTFFTCVVSSNLGAQSVYAVSAAASGPTKVTCTWKQSAQNTQACYVFDISTPGNIFLLNTATGDSGQVSVPTVDTNGALDLGTVGLDFACQSVSIANEGGSPVHYNPTSECQTLAAFPGSPFGLSGASYTGNGLAYTVYLVFSHTQWTFILLSIQPQPTITTTTSYLNTVTGWLAPDSAHQSASFLLLIYPLAGMAFGSMLMFAFKVKGDVAVYFALGGLAAGALLADLPTSGSNTLGVPFAFTFVASLLLFLFWWNS